MTMLAPVARLLESAPAQTDRRVTLDYDGRFLRRKRLVTDDGADFLVDLPSVTNLDAYWGFELEDGTTVQILPADEPVLVVTGNLPRLAWHIGNRHTPCQIETDRLVIRQDPVLERMLQGLGASITRRIEPFAPEKGAYGHGRTMGHHHHPVEGDDVGHLHG